MFSIEINKYKHSIWFDCLNECNNVNIKYFVVFFINKYIS